MSVVRHIQLYEPHEAQIPIHESDARYRIAMCGRRFGKTYMAMNEMVKYAFENKEKTVWWVAPTYQQSKIAFRLVMRYFDKIVKRANRSDLIIEFEQSGSVEFKSADRPDNLRGFGIDFLVVDEAGYVTGETWEDVLRPALADKKGHLIAIGTPKGKNWFYYLYLRGLDKEQPKYESWQLPTWDNPYINAEEIEELRETLPERVFRQEIEAEALDDTGGVFRSVRENIQNTFREPKNESYYIGVDLAKYTDFTVIVVMAENGDVVHFDRFNQLDWSLQKERIKQVANKYAGKILIDSTGVGDPIYEELRGAGLNIEGFRFTNTNKENLINKLSIAIEQNEIHYPEIPELINELEVFEYKTTNAGNVTMNAPTGFHDDCVIALALANHERGGTVRYASVRRPENKTLSELLYYG